jgi:hypothetical protein
MRHWGYSDASVTPGGPDSGIDVVASDALAQVKYETAHVGRPALQRLVGARDEGDPRPLLFFSASGYSSAAVDYADKRRIALFTYAVDGRMSPVNAPARDTVRRTTEPRAETSGEPPRQAPVRAVVVARDAGPPSRPAPREGIRTGAGLVVGGLAVLGWFVLALSKTSNRDEASDIVPILAVGTVAILLAGILIYFGLKQLGKDD